MKIPLYLVVAYRWGWANDGYYFVGCWTEQDTAIAHAKAECGDRGGKYGVSVHKFIGSDESVIHHSPSAYGEERAYCNKRLEVFDRVGCQVVRAIEEDDLDRITLEALQELIETETRILNAERPF